MVDGKERGVEYIDTGEIEDAGIIGSVIAVAVAPFILFFLWLLRRGLNNLDDDEIK